MDVVALLSLARSVEEEAPELAKDLGITTYEAALLLRAPTPGIVLRSEDRARVLDVLGKLRARGHDAVACDVSAVVSSEAMFRPRSFRFDGADIYGLGAGEERKLGDALVVLRAMHSVHTEETVVDKQRSISIGRAAMSGGLMLTRTKTTESKRVRDEREPVLYLFHSAGTPWLLHSTDLRYDGLGSAMRPSKVENFEVLVKELRERMPTVPFDTRLLAIKSANNVVASGAKHLSASSASTIDLLAHLVALAASRAKPYR